MDATTHNHIGFFQKYDELDKDLVRYCPYDGDKLKVVIIADGSSGNNVMLSVPATKKCRFCGWSI